MIEQKVLLIGSGGREHAIAWKLRQSPFLGKLDVYPGNGAFLPNEVVSLNLRDKLEFQNFIINKKYDLVVVGPEDPLVDGVSDWAAEVGVLCFGPSAFCAQIEGSKDFAKNLMIASNVPTAAFQTFTDYDLAMDYVRSSSLPIVIKADGLAAGKGVTVAETLEDALKALKEIFLDKAFGAMGKVVIEEYMSGEEASVFALCDGDRFVAFPAAQDHKRAFDGDKGPNTGGMGAYCPAPIVTTEIEEQIKRDIFQPVLEYFKKQGHPYKGLLYAGLMIDKGKARVVEFNCRFGDPETQVVLQLLEDDLLEVMLECAQGALTRNSLSIKKKSAVVVVVAAEGYPGSYKKNIPLAIQKSDDTSLVIFHAGTSVSADHLVSTGGRIFGVSAVGDNLKDAVSRVYAYLQRTKLTGTFYRKDIAWRAL